MTAYERTRQRSTAVRFTPYTRTLYPSGDTSSSVIIYYDDETCADAVHTRFPYEGGSFSLRRTERRPSSFGGKSGVYSVSTVNGTIAGTVFEGMGVYPPSAPSNVPSDATLRSQLYSYGAGAFKRFAPKPHSISLGEGFFELKETFTNFHQIMKNLRRLRTLSKREAHISELASSYLGYQFGWKPFVQDLVTCLTSIKKIDAQIESAQRNNNRWVKRSGNVLTNFETLSSRNLTGGVIVPLNYAQQLSAKDVTTRQDRIWFEGKFKYHIPALRNRTFGDRMKALPTVWDISLNPSTVYQLIPWSWLFDWFSNTGEIMYNLNQSISNNLVAKYAYLMHEAIFQVERTALWKFKYTEKIDGVGDTKYTYGAGSSATTVTCKNRIAANPFGFSLSVPSFTPWQISILLALGMR